MSSTETSTMSAADALHAYGQWRQASHGFHIEVLHPVTGEWVAVSGGTSWTDRDDIILAVATGEIVRVYDEDGGYDSPVFTTLPAHGAIAVKADTVLTVRNTR